MSYPFSIIYLIESRDCMSSDMIRISTSNTKYTSLQGIWIIAVLMDTRRPPILCMDLPITGLRDHFKTACLTVCGVLVVRHYRQAIRTSVQPYGTEAGVGGSLSWECMGTKSASRSEVSCDHVRKGMKIGYARGISGRALRHKQGNFSPCFHPPTPRYIMYLLRRRVCHWCKEPQCISCPKP